MSILRQLYNEMRPEQDDLEEELEEEDEEGLVCALNYRRAFRVCFTNE